MPDPTTIEVLEGLRDEMLRLASGRADSANSCEQRGCNHEAEHCRTESLTMRRCALLLSDRIVSLKASAPSPGVSDLPQRPARAVIIGGTMERWPVRKIEPVDLEDDDDFNADDLSALQGADGSTVSYYTKEEDRDALVRASLAGLVRWKPEPAMEWMTGCPFGASLHRTPDGDSVLAAAVQGARLQAIVLKEKRMALACGDEPNPESETP